MPVRELADPSTVEMGEAASPSAGCREVDADVVQIEATLRIAPPGHRHFSSFVSPVFLTGRRDRIPVDGLGAACRSYSRAVDQYVVKSLAGSGISCGVLLCPRLASTYVVGRELGGFDMDATANADRGRTPPGLRLALGSWVSGRGRSGGAHPSLCSASNCHLVRRRSLGGGSVSFGGRSVMSERIIPTSWEGGRRS